MHNSKYAGQLLLLQELDEQLLDLGQLVGLLQDLLAVVSDVRAACTAGIQSLHCSVQALTWSPRKTSWMRSLYFLWTVSMFSTKSVCIVSP
jgi:hypothetical protein